VSKTGASLFYHHVDVGVCVYSYNTNVLRSCAKFESFSGKINLLVLPLEVAGEIEITLRYHILLACENNV